MDPKVMYDVLTTGVYLTLGFAAVGTCAVIYSLCAPEHVIKVCDRYPIIPSTLRIINAPTRLINRLSNNNSEDK